LLIPLRRIIPGFGGLDVASLVLALAAQYLLIVLVLMIAGFGINLPFVAMIGWAAVGLGSLLLNIYFWGLLIVIIASWIAPNSYNPALILINQIIDPVMRPIRNKMPDLGGLDLSPMVLMLGIKVIEILVLYPLTTVLGIPSGILLGL
jgi:YggT family protein